jgi:hypothetical protein
MKKHCIIQESFVGGDYEHIATFLDIEKPDISLRVVKALQMFYDTEDVDINFVYFNRCIQEIINNEAYSNLRIKVDSVYIDLLLTETQIY